MLIYESTMATKQTEHFGTAFSPISDFPTGDP